jgi:hypothetical protein
MAASTIVPGAGDPPLSSQNDGLLYLDEQPRGSRIVLLDHAT